MTISNNAFHHLIQQEIATHSGKITFARFMELALYHPQYGYYQAAPFTIGKTGDFTTAPEISPIFAHCFAAPCQQVLTQLGTGDILELGPGTGSFAANLLLALEAKETLPNHYYLLEVSTTLREKQRALLRTQCPHLMSRITWLSQLPASFTGIMIANEVLDALPVHCFRIEQGNIQERCVTTINNEFAWTAVPTTASALHDKVAMLCQQYDLADGYESEVNLRATELVTSLANTLTKGVILLADYGYGQRDYYRPERYRGTLTCFYQHRHHDNPLILPGQQDITAHVDFTDVIETAANHACDLLGFTTQAGFLLNAGLLHIAAEQEKTLSVAEQFQLHQAIKTLTMPMEMGEVVKVMALGKQLPLHLAGFESHDRRRDL